MKKYNVTVWGGLVTAEKDFVSNSRNSKKHIIDTGADYCVVTDNHGNKISAAERTDNRVYNTIIAE